MRKIMHEDGKQSVRKAYEEFRTRCRARGYSPHTIARYEEIIHIFGQYYDLEKPVKSLNENVWNEYAIAVQERPVQPVTKYNYMKTMKTMKTIFYYFMDKEYIKRFEIRIQEAEKPLKEVYTEAELKRLLKKPNMKTCTFAEYRAWVIVMLFHRNRAATEKRGEYQN